MSDYYYGQIVMAGFSFAPRNFAACDGQTLPIQQNQALYALLGVMYGGNGTTSFNLPDLRGRTPAGGFASQGGSAAPATYAMGQQAGTQQVALTADQNPPHTHPLLAAAGAGVNQYQDGAALLAPVSAPARLYGPATALVPLDGGRSASTGGAPHDNMQPFQVINFIICLQGTYPSRN